MHEWKNYYIFCFTAVLPHFEDKDLITNALWDRISQTGLCPVIFAHCAMCDIGLSGGIPGGVIVTETRREQGAMNLRALINTIIMV